MPSVAADHVIGNYRVRRLIRRGVFCTLYECDPIYPDGSPIAVKVLDSASAGQPEIRECFESEFEALRRVDHAAVVGVLERGWHEDSLGTVPYIAMKYIDGERLDTYFQDRPDAFDHKLGVISVLADALHHIHQRGVLHRDLKPSNILISRAGLPTVIDFGVSLLIDEHDLGDGSHTISGRAVGTPVYMSPEQMRADPLDIRSDIYTLGVIAYELLSGRHPSDLGRVPVTRMSEVISTRIPPRLSTFVPEARGPLDRILARALEINPANRYRDAAEIRDEIRRIRGGMPAVVTTARGRLNAVRCVVRRHPVASARAAIAIGACVVLGSAALVHHLRMEQLKARTSELKQAAEDTSEFFRLVLRPDVDDNIDLDPVYAVSLLDKFAGQLDENSMSATARARSRVMLARAYQSYREDEKSLLQYPIIIDEHTKLFGEDHEWTILEHARHAKVLQYLGRSDEANEALEHATRQCTPNLIRKNPDLAGRIRYAQGVILMQQCRLNQAIGPLEQARALLARAEQNKVVQLLQIHTLYHTARIYQALDDLPRVSETLRDALALSEIRFEPDNPKLEWIRAQLKNPSVPLYDITSDTPTEPGTSPFTKASGVREITEGCD